MTPAAPDVLVEPFAGMAALSFATMGAKPPISWMGSKAGYTRVLMELLGLSRHNPPAAYIWGDVGPNVAALATLAGAGGDARDVAGWLWVGGHENPYGNDLKPQYANPEGTADGSWKAPPRDWLATRSQALPLPRAAEVAAIIRGWKDEEPRALWTRLKAAGWPSLMPVEGGRWLGPCDVEEVAGFLAHHVRTHPGGGGFIRPDHKMLTGSRAGDTFHRYLPEDPAPAIDALPARFPRVACYQGTATRLVEQLPERLDNVIAYLDPPYSGTTGYKFGGCPREEVLRLALDLHGRRATVAISEAVRLDRELGEGWTAVQIDGERRGQKRTFSVQQHEWVTMNRPPARAPGQQIGLWGAR